MRWDAGIRMLRFLCAWSIEGAEDFWQRYMNASLDDRFLIKSNMCCFDGDLFVEMGNDVIRILENPNDNSSFLR
jgi:hypothetical protein